MSRLTGLDIFTDLNFYKHVAATRLNNIIDVLNSANPFIHHSFLPPHNSPKGPPDNAPFINYSDIPLFGFYFYNHHRHVVVLGCAADKLSHS